MRKHSLLPAPIHNGIIWSASSERRLERRALDPPLVRRPGWVHGIPEFVTMTTPYKESSRTGHGCQWSKSDTKILNKTVSFPSSPRLLQKSNLHAIVSYFVILNLDIFAIFRLWIYLVIVILEMSCKRNIMKYQPLWVYSCPEAYKYDVEIKTNIFIL